MPLLQPSDYGAVRAAVDLSLTEQNLPDRVIGLDIYAGAAERDVLRRLGPEVDLNDEATAARVRSAVILATAARLLPVVPILTAERFADQSYSRAAPNLEARVAELHEQIAEELAEAAGETPPPPPPASSAPLGPVVMRRAEGRRGR